MDYKKIYDDLMRSRISMKENRKVDKKSGIYFERHHIVPVCMGADESSKLSSNNIVLLTAREHFIAHLILAEIHPDNYEIVYALFAISNQRSKDLKRHITSAKTYERIKTEFAKKQSERKKGKPGTPWSDETRKKLVPLMKGRKVSDEAKEKLRNCNLGKKYGEETKKKLSKIHKGRNHSEETKEKLSQSKIGNKNPMFGKTHDGFNKKEIYQYDFKTGIFIQKWKSIRFAAREIGCNQKSISWVLSGKKKSSLGFVWSYEYLGEKIEIDKKWSNGGPKIIQEIDDSGNIVGEWISISELSREIKISTHKIKYNIERNKKILNRNFIVS
jgi:hypothetical protein